jgi:polysaccharide biosynthesis protein VpsJ
MQLRRQSTTYIRDGALAAALELRTWLEANQLEGVDPYDALRSPLLARLGRAPRIRQAEIQVLRRLLFDPRRLLGIRPYANAKASGIVAAAAARLWALTGEAAWRGLAELAVSQALSLALNTPDGVGWGYPFDVQVRWGYYRAGTPNAIATIFTSGGLIVAGDLLGRREVSERGEAAADFLDSLLTRRDDETFYAYVPGNPTFVHNANILTAALRMRIAERRQEQVPENALAALQCSLAHRREDGSWPYGEGSGLGWVDGYHTAYVLLGLHSLESAGLGDVSEALTAGARFYLTSLFDSDGVPLATPGRRHPIDAHNVATALATLVRLSDREPRARELIQPVFDFAYSRLRASGGWFLYQRGRMLPKRVAYLRWSNAHMLTALAACARFGLEKFSGARDDGVPVP